LRSGTFTIKNYKRVYNSPEAKFQILILTQSGFAPKVPKMTDFRCRIWTLGAS